MLFRNYIGLACATFVAFIFPSFCFSFYHDYLFRFDLYSILSLGAAALIFPLVRPRIFMVIIFILFAIMEIVQFSHLYYYNKPLNVFALHLMFSDFGEVAESALDIGGGDYKKFVHVFIIIANYSLLSFLYLRVQRKTSFIAFILAIILLGILPHKALYRTPRLANFAPKNDSISLYNSLNTFNGYFFVYLRQKRAEIKNFPEYSYTFTESKNQNIILILGESVNANRIGLLGYERNTNPLLSQYAKENENFVARKAISSSVLTRVAIPSFLNIAYYPEDIQHVMNEKTHLVGLAKKAGFKNFYYSTQSIAELGGLSTENLDEFFTQENVYAEYEKIGDMVLLNRLEANKDKFINGKNFLILHQRNAHSPYQIGYRGYEKADVFKPQTRENTYDNAMIFNDYLIYRVIEIFKEISAINKIPTTIIFIPDHGEAMGEIGKNGTQEYGHAFLSKNVANIPVFATSFYDNDNEVVQWLKNSEIPTHYELGKLLAKQMGYEIHNPLEQQDIFYINGTDIAGNDGYMKVKRQGENIQYEYMSKE